MGGMFGGAPQPPKLAQPASATPLNAVQVAGKNFGPNTQAAGIMFGDPASALGSQSMALNPGLGSLEEYIQAAQQFLGGGSGGQSGPQDPRGPGATLSNLGGS